MGKLDKSKLCIVLVVVGCVAFIIGLFGFSTGGGLGVILIISAIVLISKDKKEKERQRILSMMMESKQTEIAQVMERTPVPDGQMNYDILDDTLDNAVLAYKYEWNMYLTDGSVCKLSGNGGKDVSFKFEPENEYDKNAIMILLNGEKIGYVFRGNGQNMIRDYTNRGWPIRAYINKFSIADNKATYKIGFYKPFSEFRSKSVKLTGLKGKDEYGDKRFENLFNCSEGDVLEIESDDDKYIVFDGPSEVGILPKSGYDFLEQESWSKAIAVIDSIEYDEDTPSAKVSIYILE